MGLARSDVCFTWGPHSSPGPSIVLFSQAFPFVFSVQFSSVAPSCPTLCDPMNCSTPGLPVLSPTPRVHPNPCPLSRWCHPTISSSVVPFSSFPQSFPASGSFQMSQLSASGGQSIGISALTSVPPMNSQVWSLGRTGWMDWLQSKGLSRIFSNSHRVSGLLFPILTAAAAAAESHQSVCDSVRPHRRQPTRLRCPWDSPGKNTGVGCRFLLQCMKVKSESEVTQSCPTLSDPMDCSPPGSSVHGIFQQEDWSGSPVPSLPILTT